MKVGELNDAKREALNKFDEWNNVTGCFEKATGYYYEIQGVVEDAVDIGAKAASGGLDADRLRAECETLRATIETLNTRWQQLADLTGAGKNLSSITATHRAACQWIKDRQAECEALKTELEAVKYAAHMPDDYEYGLPGWINQRLYACFIGMELSPAIAKILDDEERRFAAAACEAVKGDIITEIRTRADSKRGSAHGNLSSEFLTDIANELADLAGHLESGINVDAIIKAVIGSKE